jgi:hypothetical protein
MSSNVAEGLSPSQLEALVKQAGAEEFLVSGLLRAKSIAFLFGDSGLGKSALAYQLAVWVAGGVPFLGFPTRRGRVFYMDFENSPEQALAAVNAIAGYLGVSREVLDANLVLWNVNTTSAWSVKSELTTYVAAHKPDLVILDSFGSFRPDAEEKNSAANRELQKMRKLLSTYHVGFFVLHHLKKENDNAPPLPLEDVEPVQRWFQRVRGASAVINGSDLRLGAELSRKHRQAALVLRGFARVKGEVPRLYLRRVMDDDGQPVAYELMGGLEFFTDTERDIFQALPAKFRFKDARPLWERALAMENAGKKPRDEDISKFLTNACSAGMLRKLPGREGYQKQGQGPK